LAGIGNLSSLISNLQQATNQIPNNYGNQRNSPPQKYAPYQQNMVRTN
jgi:hypothetical protein